MPVGDSAQCGVAGAEPRPGKVAIAPGGVDQRAVASGRAVSPTHIELSLRNAQVCDWRPRGGDLMSTISASSPTSRHGADLAVLVVAPAPQDADHAHSARPPPAPSPRRAALTWTGRPLQGLVES